MKEGTLTITDSDGDRLNLIPESDRDNIATFETVSPGTDMVNLTADDLRSIRTWIDERLGDKVEADKEEPAPWIDPAVWRTTLYVEPERFLFGVPESVVQGLVEAALKSATVRMEGE